MMSDGDWAAECPLCVTWSSLKRQCCRIGRWVRCRIHCKLPHVAVDCLGLAGANMGQAVDDNACHREGCQMPVSPTTHLSSTARREASPSLHRRGSWRHPV